MGRDGAGLVRRYQSSLLDHRRSRRAHRRQEMLRAVSATTGTTPTTRRLSGQLTSGRFQAILAARRDDYVHALAEEDITMTFPIPRLPPSRWPLAAQPGPFAIHSSARPSGGKSDEATVFNGRHASWCTCKDPRHLFARLPMPLRFPFTLLALLTAPRRVQQGRAAAPSSSTGTTQGDAESGQAGVGQARVRVRRRREHVRARPAQVGVRAPPPDHSLTLR